MKYPRHISTYRAARREHAKAEARRTGKPLAEVWAKYRVAGRRSQAPKGGSK